MYKYLILLSLFCKTSAAQNNIDNNTIKRKGFIVGFGLGSGILTLSEKESWHPSFSASLPNIRIGYRIGDRLALMALLPGATYRYQGKDRGFEGILLAAQYWVKDRWWILGGVGLVLDAPAFYTVKSFKEADFHTGFPAITLATGYDVWRKGKFTLDLHYRLFSGQASLAGNEHRRGVSNMFMVGFSWY